MTNSLSDAHIDLILLLKVVNVTLVPLQERLNDKRHYFSLWCQQEEKQELVSSKNGFPMETQMQKLEWHSLFWRPSRLNPTVNCSQSPGLLVPRQHLLPLGLPGGPTLHWIWQSCPDWFLRTHSKPQQNSTNPLSCPNSPSTLVIQSFLGNNTGCQLLQGIFLALRALGKGGGGRKGKAEMARPRKRKKCLNLGC